MFRIPIYLLLYEVSTPKPQLDVNVHFLRLGDLPREITQISLPPTASVSLLQQAIKAAYRPRLDSLAATHLKLWKTSIPRACDSIEGGIDKLSLDDWAQWIRCQKCPLVPSLVNTSISIRVSLNLANPTPDLVVRVLMSHAPVLYSQVLHIQRHCDGLLAFQQHQKSTAIQESVTLMACFRY